MSQITRRIGRWGEQTAADYLVSKGYRLLERNLHFPVGEIDLVAQSPGREQDSLVFVEVKTRTSAALGYPEESFTPAKYRHLQAAIQAYLETHPDQVGEWQIDLVAVLGNPDHGTPQISHYPRIVMPDERE